MVSVVVDESSFVVSFGDGRILNESAYLNPSRAAEIHKRSRLC